MKKKFSFFVVALAVIFAFSAFSLAKLDASSSENGKNYVYANGSGYISSADQIKLNQAAADIFKNSGVEVFFVIDEDYTNDTAEYARDFCDDVAEGNNAVLLMVTKDYWYIHTCGTASVITEEDQSGMWASYDDADTYYAGVDAFFKTTAQKLVFYGIKAQAAPSQNTNEPNDAAIPGERQRGRLVDDADILNSDEEAALTERLNAISESQKCDVAIITVYSLGDKTATEFADDFYDYNGYGMNDTDGGILFLISMQERDWAISTYGFGITAFTDAGQQYITNRIMDELGSGEYYKAFSTFAELCDEFITQAKTGEAYDTGNLPKGPFSLVWVAVAIGVGLAVGLGVTGAMKAQLKSVKMQTEAQSYMREGSFGLTGSYEAFMYSNVSKTAIPKETSSSGGSSTHTSSSGRSHGGSSGKF